VVEVAALAEVRAGPRVVGRDDVPARTALAEQVERVQALRQVVGVVVGGVLRCDETDALGDGGQRGELRLSVGAPGDVEIMDAAEVFAQSQALAEEEGREQAALGGLGDAAERLEVVLRAAAVARPDGSEIDALEEDSELDAAGRGNANSFTAAGAVGAT